MSQLSSWGPNSALVAAADLGDAVLAHINQDRAAVGRAPLRRNALLDQSALGYAQFVATHGWNASDPHGADGRTPFQRIAATGYASQWEGENLALGFPTPESVDLAWDHSPEHYANLIFPNYTELGIGWAFGNFGGAWVEDFGSRAVGPPPPPPPPPPGTARFQLVRYVGSASLLFLANSAGEFTLTETGNEFRFTK
jgi:uncharacterized protein YkwD